ncbi:MAG: hypothetical protein DYG94_01395 [Leptolyngbya sp. PLA3]|nr:MAG: hypothetical protein EDM82_00485 [Cyanobacteria bacterium CYA]MCE7967386.1 hypothetical protein [Leptolyngbya sp. PL-A3]
MEARFVTLESAGDQARASDGSVLARYLDGEHAPCPVCEYDLFKVNGSECPECGSPIQLGVVSPHACPGPWLLGVIAFALALGFDGVVLLLMFVPMLAQGVPAFSAAPQFWALYLMMWCLGGASATGLTLVLRRKRQWQSHPVKKQRRLGWMVFLGVGFGHALCAGSVVALLVL